RRAHHVPLPAAGRARRGRSIVPESAPVHLGRRHHAGDVEPGVRAAFGVTLLDGYGITETSTMVTMNWPTGTRVPGSCGFPVPGLSVRIVDAVHARDVVPGEEGELIVRGPSLMPGYHNKPEETAKALRNGWYHTGDLA